MTPAQRLIVRRFQRRWDTWAPATRRNGYEAHQEVCAYAVARQLGVSFEGVLVALTAAGLREPEGRAEQ